MKKLRHSPTAACPCRVEEGGNMTYADCCSPFHAALAAALLAQPGYAPAPWHPSTAPGDLELGPIKWLGLQVLAAQASADAGVVEFVARFKDNGKAGQLHETSRFVQEVGRWYYIDGQMLDPTAP